MKKITASILTTLLMLSMVFSSSVFAANEETSAWDSFLGLFSAKASADDVGVEYRGHIQNVGDYPTDGSWIQGPERLGTVGKSLRLEAFWIKLTDAPEGLHIKYEVHVQNIGWMDPVEDGALAGTQGDSLRIEAIKISLVDDEGNVSGDYTVTYKGHIQNVGDTAWIKSGQQLGTTGSGLRLEALEVKIEKIAPDLTDYEAALAAVTEANYTKASWAAYQDVVEDNVMTEDNVQSEVDAATAIILDAQEDLVTVPVISAVTATAQKTITVTGTELSKLSASMFTVASNTVTAVTPNADGTSATLTLGTDLVPETNTKVTAAIDGTSTDYTVKYTIKAVTVAIQAGTYDDDKAGQALTVLVDGVATTPSYLVAQGYTVTFNAWDKNGTVANTTLFGAATSSTGDIKVPQATEADYTAQVTIAKGSTVISSTKATIKIRDLDNNANAISSYVLKNTTNAATTQQFTMSSSSLVVSEKATFTKVVVGYGDAAAELTTGYTVESSNTAVISVDSTTGQMTANGLGTADITITVGAATKVVPLTVVGTKRVVTSATPASATLTSIKNAGAQTMTVTFKDQYGDPIVGTLTSANHVKFTATSITGVTLNTSSPFTNFTTAAKGEQTVSFTNTTATAGSTGVVVFRDANDVVIGSFNIVTSDVNNKTIKKVEIDTDAAASSKDDTIDTDLTSDKKITYKVSLFNSDGVANGSVTNLAGYTVTFNKDIVNVRGDVNTTPSTANSYTLGTNDTKIIVTGLKAGTTTMEIRDNGNQVIDTRTVTVLKGVPYVTGISFKSTSAINYATTVKYTNVVNVQEMSNDDIVNGVTLSVASVYKVRIDELGTFPGSGTTTVGAKGNLYLDKDDSGRYNEGDIKLAALTISNSVTSGSSAWDTAVTNSIDGRAVTDGNVGTITFTLTDTVTSTLPIVATAPISINVPQSAAQSAAEAAVTKWENEVNAIDDNTKLAAAIADTAGNKAAATTAIAALPGADQAPYTARVTAAQNKATAGNTLKTAVDTFVALPVASDANITTAVTGITTVGTAVTTATTAGVPTAYINGADVATKIATKTTAINAARTIDSTQTTITATALANATVGTSSTAVVVPKNAAGVPLSTCLTGAYAVTYNWTVTSATPFTSAVLTNGTTDTATITITTANLTVTPVGLQCVISQGSAATVTKTANMVVTGL